MRPSRLRQSDVDHPFQGANSFDIELESILGRCRAYEPLLTAARFYSHVTAAALWGIPLAPDVDRSSLDVSTVDPVQPPRGRGIRGHRMSGVTVALADGYPATSPADTWIGLAEVICREDLVAAGDFLVTGEREGRDRRGPSLCSISQLADAVARHAGKRGCAAARWALPRIRSGVDSRMETRTRLLLIAARLPEPEIGVGVPVFGGLVLHPDLSYPRWKIAFEYEGDDHRVDRRTWKRDIRRRELLEEAGWKVIRVISDDIFVDPGDFIRRVRSAIASRRAL